MANMQNLGRLHAKEREQSAKLSDLQPEHERVKSVNFTNSQTDVSAPRQPTAKGRFRLTSPEAQTYSLTHPEIMSIANPGEAMDRSAAFLELANRERIAQELRTLAASRAGRDFVRTMGTRLRNGPDACCDAGRPEP
jgi:hypothetical protein